MDVLLIGSRGREHATALALKKDDRVDKIFCIPGNGGIGSIATCVNIGVTDYKAILQFLDDTPNIKLTVVSPDETLSGGLVDLLNSNGHRAFGPSSLASIMESSKEFYRDLCSKYSIPAPTYRVFDDYAKAKKYVYTQKFPLVIKTEGRTAGKGIVFCRNLKEAENAMYDIMIAELFGEAGRKVDIEQFIEGDNVTVMCLCDGKTIKPMRAVDNYKRVFDDNMGMSTAGMGASTPSRVYTEEIAEVAYNKIFVPTMNALNAEGRPFRGVLSFNLIVSGENVTVVDYIVRFCDIESQVVIPLLKTPLLDIFNSVIDQKLDEINLEWEDSAAVCVVMTAGGYPLDYNKNTKINIGDLDSDVTLFHAGTKMADGELRTSGGRVMSLFSSGNTKEECAVRIYKNIQNIAFDGMHYRKDIAKK